MVCGKDHNTFIFLRHVGTYGYIIIQTKYGGFHFTFFWNSILWGTNFFTVPSIDKLLSIIKLLSKLLLGNKLSQSLFRPLTLKTFTHRSFTTLSPTFFFSYTRQCGNEFSSLIYGSHIYKLLSIIKLIAKL